MIYPYFSTLCRYLIIIAFCFATSLANDAYAKKIHAGLCGTVYLASGDSISANGELRVSIPNKKKKVEIIRNAYTHSSEVESRIDPSDIDSLVVWSASAPKYPHVFRYIKEYGWCYQAERSPFLSVLCFAPKGYYCSGNGGVWMNGNSKMLLIKHGSVYDFGQPKKKVNKRIVNQLKFIVGDDPDCLEYLNSARGRRDKVIRSLIMYIPKS